MPISVNEQSDTRVIEINGRLDVLTAAEVKRLLLAEVESAQHALIVSLEHTSFIDSSGLGVLIAVHRALAERGVPLFVAAPRPQAQLVVQITNIRDLIEVIPSVTEARARARAGA